MKFVRELIPRSASSGSSRIAALNDEAVDHAMKNNAVVEFLFHERDKVAHGLGSLLFEQLDGEIAHRRFKVRVRACFHFSIVAFLM